MAGGWEWGGRLVCGSWVLPTTAPLLPPPPEGGPSKGQEQHLKLGVSPAFEAPFPVCSSLSSAIQLLKVNS